MSKPAQQYNLENENTAIKKNTRIFLRVYEYTSIIIYNLIRI